MGQPPAPEPTPDDDNVGRSRRVLTIAAAAGAATFFVAATMIARDFINAPETVLEVESVAAAPTRPLSLGGTFAGDAGRLSPRSITIGAIELWSAVRPVGIAANGELEVPDEAEVGWYEHGSAPGLAGATVLAGHVSWNGAIGPFYELGKLEPGDIVSVRLHDGTPRDYEVVERTMYPKDALPADRIWRNSGAESLVLITCGGSFNESARRFRDNIVVYAVPVDT